MMTSYFIVNGTVYDPAKHRMYLGDIAVEEGKIVAGRPSGEYETIDASGCIVTTGLIDYHVHYFNHGTENGVNADAASFPCGITTVVDGGSAGAGNYEMYRKSAMAFSDVRIFNQLLMGSGGQATERYPEHLEEQYFDKDKIRKLFRQYPDNLKGLKLRLSKGIIEPEEARRSLKSTVELAEELGCNVCVHVTNPVIPIEEIAAGLRKNDVMCHIYQGKSQDTILDEDGRIKKGINQARERGVLFDASNGCNNFDLEICRKALEQGFVPDIISSDMNVNGFYMQPLHSFPKVLSKFISLGMKIEDVLDAATITPAKLLKREELASLAADTEADLAIFKLEQHSIKYRDKAGHAFVGHEALVPQMTIKGGRIMYSQVYFT